MIHKGNEIIEIRDFLLEQLKDLSLQEWRLLGFYLEKINPRDITTRFVRIDLDDYIELLDLGEDPNIPYLKESSKKLLQKVVDGRDPDKHVVYSQTTIFQRCRLMTDEKGKYYFELNAADDALPLLFDFKDHYIKARGMNIFELNSSNQILMYFFICKQIGLGKRSVEITVDELRDWLGIKTDVYQRFGDFNNYVLSVCERALREHSDLCFTYEKGRLGAHGKCETLKIHIRENKAVIKQLETKIITDVASVSKLEVAEINNITELCEKNLNRKLCEIEKDWIRTWVNDYGMTEVLVKRAFEDNLFRSHLTLKNVNDTLIKWNEQGIRTLEAAERFCKEEHNANIRKAARRSSKNGTVWRTGAEAGIDVPDEIIPEEADSVTAKKETSTFKQVMSTLYGDDGIPEDILDMFGDTSDEVDENVDI